MIPRITSHAPEEPAFCIAPSVLLALLEEVGRGRALTDEETDMVQDCIELERVPFRWTPRLEVALRVASASPGGIARFARRHGMTVEMARQKLFRLRRKEGK